MTANHPSPLRGGAGVGVTFALAVAILTSAGCIARPPALGPQALLTRGAGEEAALAKRVSVHRDPGPAAYVATIAARLVPSGGAVSVTVIDDPTLAAFVMPSGRVYVHTGLLSRLTNEDELALVLALELARDPRGQTLRLGPAMTGSLPHGDLSPTGAAILGLDLRIAAAAAIGGYGEDREGQAEREAIQRLAAPRYDGGRALALFQRLSTPPGVGGPLEIFVYGDPRRMAERYRAMRPLVAAGGVSAPGDRSDFETRMRSVVRDNASLELRVGRFDLAETDVVRVLAEDPRDPAAVMVAAEIARLRAQRVAAGSERATYMQEALRRYRRAMELDPSNAEPLRQLGLLYYQEHDIANARAAFERYLAVAPAAADAARIREYLAVVGEVKP